MFLEAWSCAFWAVHSGLRTDSTDHWGILNVTASRSSQWGSITWWPGRLRLSQCPREPLEEYGKASGTFELEGLEHRNGGCIILSYYITGVGFHNPNASIVTSHSTGAVAG